METMTDRNALALTRNRQLVALRAANGKAEEFSVRCACAAQDREFQATFKRVPPATQYRCAAIEKAGVTNASPLARLQGLLRKPDAALRVSADEIAFDTLSCAWCSDADGWTLCDRCGCLVCSANTVARRFTCRDSCGRTAQTSPMDALDASDGASAPDRLLIGARPGMKLLPRR